jgi:hypothetical protein
VVIVAQDQVERHNSSGPRRVSVGVMLFCAGPVTCVGHTLPEVLPMKRVVVSVQLYVGGTLASGNGDGLHLAQRRMRTRSE